MGVNYQEEGGSGIFEKGRNKKGGWKFSPKRSDPQASGEIKKKFFMSIQGELGTAWL